MKSWKTALKEAISPPPPERKRAFLRRLPQPELPWYSLLLTQAGYLPQWIWGLAALVFGAAWLLSRHCAPESIWVFSSLTPLLALTALTESGRSEARGMAELEMATRFSLRSVILMRLAILGLFNFLLLGVLAVLASRAYGVLAAGVYLLTPFLLTSLTGIRLLRRHRGQEGLYLCVGTSVLISAVSLLTGVNYPQIYGETHLLWWSAAAFFFCIGAGKQYTAFINQTEEIVWSLS